MRISKRAWHYRLINWTYGEHPKSLCPYFWTMNWCIVSCIPRYLIRKLFDRIDEAGHQQLKRQAELYREMSDLQAFRLLASKYPIDELIHGGYSRLYFPRAVNIWWSQQQNNGRNPAVIISELATSYQEGKIEFKALTIKRAIFEPIVSYFPYLYVGTMLICMALLQGFISEAYWTSEAEMHTVAQALLLSLGGGIFFPGIVFGVIIAIGHDSGWWKNIRRRYCVPREDDMVGAMIKAWHRKACPMLEFSNK